MRPPLCSGKITLMILLFMFTFITMVGGNPIKDAYGFRYWKDPGPISNYYGDSKSGELRAFLAAILGAAFAVAGPDMLSLIVSLQRRLHLLRAAAHRPPASSFYSLPKPSTRAKSYLVHSGAFTSD